MTTQPPVSGVIDLPDPPPPPLFRLPSVLVSGPSESGDRFAVTHRFEIDTEDDAPQSRRRS